MDADVVLFGCLAGGVLFVAPVAVVQPMPAHVDVAGWSTAVLYGLLNFTVAYMLYWAAAEKLPMTRFSVLAYLEPVVAIGCAALWLGEAITTHAAAGGVLILASGAIVAFGNKNAR